MNYRQSPWSSRWIYVLTALYLVLASSARAQTNSWIDGTGKWEDGANWSSGGPPFNGEAVYITNTTSKTVTIDTNTTINSEFSLTIGTLTLSAPGAASNTLKVVNADGVPFQMNTLFVGAGGSLFVSNTTLNIAISNTISNGHVVVLNTTTIPSTLGSTNFALVVTGSSATFSNSGPTAFENALNNSVVVTNGGRLDTDDLYVGYKLSNVLLRADLNVFTVTGTNSQLNSHILSIGEVGSSNQFIVGNGATMHVRSALRLSSTSNTLGNVMQVLPGGTLTVGDNVFVGNTNGAGAAMNIAGGLSTLASNLITASFANSTGSVNVTGGQLVATNGVTGIGNNGSVTNGFGVGTMVVSNATFLGKQVLLGSSVGGRGQLTVKTNGLVNLVGTGAVLVANDLTVVGGDVEIVNGIIYCGESHPGAMTLSNGTANAQITYVGYDSQGTLSVYGGQMTLSSLLEIGQLSASTGSVWISGGQFTATALSTTVGNQGVGQMSISNGIVTVADVVVGNSSNPGTLTLAGGTLTVNTLSLPNVHSRFNFTGGWLNALGITNSNGQMLTLGNGVTPITLSLLGGISSLGNGLQIATNATLTGFGTINGSILNNGLIVVDGGTLTFTGIVTNNGVINGLNGGVNFNFPPVGSGVVITSNCVATITAIQKVNADIHVSFTTCTNGPYVVEYETDTVTGSWTTLTNATGTGSTITITDSGAALLPQRFYRVDLVVSP